MKGKKAMLKKWNVYIFDVGVSAKFLRTSFTLIWSGRQVNVDGNMSKNTR